VPAREFFLGYYTTALNPDEMIVEVHIPLSEGPWGFAEIARRSGDFALAGAFLHRHHNLADVTWFGVGASPIRVQGVSVASDVTQRVAAWRDALLQEMAQPVDTVRVQQAAWVAEQAYQQTLQGGLSQ
jgi:CO/xanthine dehydrogenase FAD-binding subunit